MSSLNQKMKTLGKYEQPFFGVMQLLHRCMAKCKMCNMWLGEETPDELTIAETIEYTSRLAKIARKDFEYNILGGETLMKKDIEQLISHTNRMGMKPIVSTNGFLITREKAKSLHDAGLVHYTMSLDSLRSEIHDYYRGTKGAFDHVRKALSNLHQAYGGKQFVCIIAIIMKHNYGELVELARWARSDPRVCSISFLALTNPCWTFDKDWHRHPTSKDIWPDVDEIPEVIESIKKLKEMKQNGYQDYIVNPISQLDAFIEYYRNGPGHPITYDYEKFKGYVMVKPDGGLFMSGEYLGNIRKDDITELWFSEKADACRKKIETRQTNVEIILNCKHGFEAY